MGFQILQVLNRGLKQLFVGIGHRVIVTLLLQGSPLKKQHTVAKSRILDDFGCTKQDNRMGMMKNYLLNLLQQCSEEQIGQDAIEWAIVSGRVSLSYNLEGDVQTIMSSYDDIIEAYRKARGQYQAQGRGPGLPARLGPRRARAADPRQKVTSKRKQSAA